MRIIHAAGCGLPAMTKTQHGQWVEAITRLHPAVFTVTEQWFRRYLRWLRAAAPGYTYYGPLTLPWGNQGSGVAWRTDEFTVLGKGCIRLHGLIRDRRRINSGVRRLAFVILRDDEDREWAIASLHVTPHQKDVPAAMTAYHRAMPKVQAWIETHARLGRKVIIGGDFNAGHSRVAPYFRAPTHLVTSTADKEIDHVLVRGARVTSSMTITGTPSDHAPLVVDVA